MKKLLISALLAPACVYAAEPTSLETVTVTAKGFENSMTTSLRDYEVINVGALESQYSSLNDLLNDVVGVNTAKLSNRMLRQPFTLEGLNLDKTLVLLNGKKIGSATLGEASIQNIPVSQIERIEVMKGNGSVLYGAAAIAGVINIITKSADTTKVTASVASQETVATGFQHFQSISNIAETGFSWNFEKSTGTSAREGEWTSYSTSGTFDNDEDGFENHSINAFANVELTKGLEIKNNFFRSAGTYEYDSTSNDDQATFKNTQLSSELLFNLNNLSTSVHASRQVDLTVNYGGDNSRQEADRFTTISDSAHAQAMYQLNQLELITGVEWQTDYVGSSSLANSYERENIVSRSAFAVATAKLSEIFKVSAGSRRDTTNAFGTHLTYNVSAQAAVKQHTVIISQQSGYQTPTFNDLYWPGAGNPDLQPEISKSKFVKYSFSTLDTSVGVKLLRNDLSDQIAWAPNNDGNWEPSNINFSTIESTQINWEQNWSQAFSTELGSEKTIAINNADDRKLALVPEYSASLKVAYKQGSFSSFTKVNYVGVRLNSSRNENLMPYSTLDLGISATPYRNLAVSLLGTNILDREYTPNSTYVNEPLTVKGTVSYQF